MLRGNHNRGHTEADLQNVSSGVQMVTRHSPIQTNELDPPLELECSETRPSEAKQTARATEPQPGGLQTITAQKEEATPYQAMQSPRTGRRASLAPGTQGAGTNPSANAPAWHGPHEASESKLEATRGTMTSMQKPRPMEALRAPGPALIQAPTMRRRLLSTRAVNPGGERPRFAREKVQESLHAYEARVTRQLEEIVHLKADNAELLRTVDDLQLTIDTGKFATLSHLVSSKLPDDQIMQRFSAFWKDGVSDWCFGASRKEATQQQADGVKRLMIQDGLCLPDDRVEPHLRLDFSKDPAFAILLQAALSRYLCRHFLTNPFFAAADLQSGLGGEQISSPSVIPESLNQLYKTFNKAESLHNGDATKWRVQTVELIQTITALDRLASTIADDFLGGYASLIEDASSPVSRSHLRHLFREFAEFTQQLWKLDGHIRFNDLQHLWTDTFTAADTRMTTDETVGLRPGDSRLQGRPICAMVRPLIFSIREGGTGVSDKEVIWSKAAVWVSSI